VQPSEVLAVPGDSQGVARPVRDGDKRGVIILLSGGVDSTCLLHKAVEERERVFAVGVNYGQRHNRELTAAANIAAHYGVPFWVHRLPPLCGSALTGDGDIPTGLHYTDPGQSATVVPGRNLLLLGVAVAEAVRLGCSDVWYGAHAGDVDVYPDCRPEFTEAVSAAAQAGYGVAVCAPWQNVTKVGIAKYAVRKGVPVELTWSCYVGGDKPCDQCGACVERNEAFSEVD
jgi:7-cyano-7-deazaguanine synthase